MRFWEPIEGTARMTVTRRTILSTGTVVAGAAAFADVGVAPASAASAGLALRRSTFVPLRGRYLQAVSGTHSTRVRLVEIRDVVGNAAGSDSSFLLQFTATDALDDGLYTLAHGAARHPNVFLSGVGADGDRRYEVVVNHAVAPHAATA